MSWLKGYIKSSIGKKQIMALTGLCLIAFIAAHLYGNLMIYRGVAAYDNYWTGIQSPGPLVTPAGIALLFLAAVHVLVGAILFIQNRRARPVRYVVSKSARGKTVSSALMPYTGLYLIFYLTVHLHIIYLIYPRLTGSVTLSQFISETLSWPGYAVFYFSAVIALALHVNHGFWSAFQTLGANHPGYMLLLNRLSLILALALALGFGSLPIYFIITA